MDSVLLILFQYAVLQRHDFTLFFVALGISPKTTEVLSNLNCYTVLLDKNTCIVISHYCVYISFSY